MQYEVSDDQDSVQMLQRSSQVGEFYRMSPPPVPKFDPTTKRLPPEYMDILIYDEEMDQLKHISFEQALFACGLNTVADLCKAVGVDDVNGLFPEMEGQDGDAGKSGVDAEGRPKAIADIKDVAAAVNAGRYIKMCIVIARPFIEHLMMSAVATVSGRDTGATLFGPADM